MWELNRYRQTNGQIYLWLCCIVCSIVVLMYCHIVVLLYCCTVVSLYYRIVAMLCFCVVILFCSCVVMLSWYYVVGCAYMIYLPTLCSTWKTIRGSSIDLPPPLTMTTNGCTYLWIFHVLIVRWCMWYRSHGAGDIQMHNFKTSTKTVEVQWKTDGMGIDTHRQHVGAIQKNIKCGKS